ncbi:STAS domain-containing protein [Hymenobacter persicinus]|uniref:STAS domain-containing protein n=1 Tax=Hymenobacter persicinus TaxID=2025506 RepID=A0A4Q5L858_9BACT|nr:STAS domain-containing protein [Hymenobacter persicinus]RYU77201.1 hypothetical protein EWM57_17690 [Hymenobacter persicinus]
MNKLLPQPQPTQLNFTPYLIRVDLDAVNCPELARNILSHQPLRRPRLIVDCQCLRCLRTRGVAHFVSQLLLLHQAGAQVLLLNVPNLLRRCLRLLRLEHTFQLEPTPSPLAHAA